MSGGRQYLVGSSSPYLQSASQIVFFLGLIQSELLVIDRHDAEHDGLSFSFICHFFGFFLKDALRGKNHDWNLPERVT